jgi:hypothetical protein
MTEKSPPESGTRLPPWLPVVVVALGVLLIAVTVRGVGGLNHGRADGIGHGLRPPLAILTGFALAGIATSYAKHRDDGYGLLGRAGTACAVLLTVAAILVPFGLLMLGQRGTVSTTPTEPTATASGTQPSHTVPITARTAIEPSTKAQSHWWSTVAGFIAVAIITAIIVLVAVVIFNILKRSRIRLDLGPTAQFGDLGDAEELADAVAAAAAALDYRGDTREAVIACYAAMEARIAEAGVGRQTADTPEDLLRRATTSGLVPVGPGTRLTELFREARYSRHSMTEGHRDEARSALTQISEHLRATRTPQDAGASS